MESYGNQPDHERPRHHTRRRFLGTAALTLAGAPFGLYCAAGASEREPRELAAIARGKAWLSSPPLTVADLRGKVLLVDFCTYTCINWLRTLPYVRAWATKYKDSLTVIGVHTPEFPFEHDLAHVRRALEPMALGYPVVTDNDFAIWRAFTNNYWPALYFIDARGKVRDHHFGEGEYERSERIIQKLLSEAGAANVSGGLVSGEARGIELAADWNNLRSPETYLGYQRTERFASSGGDPDRRRSYAIPKRLSLNDWALAGDWTLGPHAAVLDSASGRLAFRFHARDVHLVLGPPRASGAGSRDGAGSRGARIRVSLDGQPPGAAHGADVDAAGNGTIVEPRLYQLIRQTPAAGTGGAIGDRTFEIEFLDPGAEAYAFTFG